MVPGDAVGMLPSLSDTSLNNSHVYDSDVSDSSIDHDKAFDIEKRTSFQDEVDQTDLEAGSDVTGLDEGSTSTSKWEKEEVHNGKSKVLKQTSRTKVKRKENPTKSKKQAKTLQKKSSTSNTLRNQKHIDFTIHKADKLRITKEVTSPVVNVSLFDTTTRQLVHDRGTANGPICATQPYSFRTNRSIAPVWEQTLTVEMDYDLLTEPHSSTVAIFEISGRPPKSGRSNGWDTSSETLPVVCWGFLKLVGASGKNTEQQARLQLYEYTTAARRLALNTRAGKKSAHKGETDEASIEQRDSKWAKRIDCILSGPRKPYPSTLFVSIHPTDAKDKRSSVDERVENDGNTEDWDGGGTNDRIQKPMWLRLPGQKCLIPETFQREIPHEQGCSRLAFSTDGAQLAAACADYDSFPIVVYQVLNSATTLEVIDESKTVLRTLSGHQNIVNDLHWAADDSVLISASSDCTARLWELSNVELDSQISSSHCKILPHPCFVYSAKLLPVDDGHNDLLAFTGSYDGVIRLWDLATPGPAGTVIQELHHHDHNVNALALDTLGMKLFSGDGHGIINIWTRKGSDWDVAVQVDHPEIKGYPINTLEVHPTGRRLLVHVRDNVVRMLDLRTNSFMQRYHGSTNQRNCLRASISGCGGFVVGGSEDGTAHLWNADTGEMVHHFSDLLITSPVHDASFHPHDHLVAFCSFAPGQPILIYRHRKSGLTNDLQTPQSYSAQSGTLQMTSSNLKAAMITTGPSTSTIYTPSRLPPIQNGKSPGILESSAASYFTQPPLGMSLPGSMVSPQGGDVGTNGILGLADFQERRELLVEDLLSQATSTLDARRNALNEQSTTPIPLFPDGRRLAPSDSKQARPTSNKGINKQLSDTMDMSELMKGLRSKPTNEAKPSQKHTTSTLSKSMNELKDPEMYRATHSYKACRGDEISFHEGQVLEVTAKSSNMWWLARLKNKESNEVTEVGLVPANFLRKRRIGKQKDVDVAEELSKSAPLSTRSERRRRAKAEQNNPVTLGATIDVDTRRRNKDAKTEPSEIGDALRESRRLRRARRIINETSLGEV